MPLIALEHLVPHPDNANRMSVAMMKKLIAHIRETGEYPALIVRPLKDSYQILDGHHRAEALRRLGHTHARCDVWDADDARAGILLLTLNRLRGEDDPQRRGTLLEKMSRGIALDDLARIAPETKARIQRLMRTTQPPLPLAQPPNLDDLPQAVTFFLGHRERRQLLKRLRDVSPDRNAALVQILELQP